MEPRHHRMASLLMSAEPARSQFHAPGQLADSQKVQSTGTNLFRYNQGKRAGGRLREVIEDEER